MSGRTDRVVPGPGDAIQISFVEVTTRPHESTERMIKRFTRKVREDGVLREAHDRRSFEKPSVKRRRKRARAKFLSRPVSEK